MGLPKLCQNEGLLGESRLGFCPAPWPSPSPFQAFPGPRGVRLPSSSAPITWGRACVTAPTLGCEPAACPSPLLACAGLQSRSTSYHTFIRLDAGEVGEKCRSKVPVGVAGLDIGSALGRSTSGVGTRQGDLQRLRNAWKRGKESTHPTGSISSSGLKWAVLAKINEVLVGGGRRHVPSSHRGMSGLLSGAGCGFTGSHL